VFRRDDISHNVSCANPAITPALLTLFGNNPDNRDWIDAQRIADVNQLNYIKTSLTTFVFGNERLRFSQAVNHLLLGKARIQPGCHEQAR